MKNFMDVINEVEISNTESFIIEQRMSGWNKVADILYNDDINETKLLAMIKVECATSHREQILKRLYSRYNSLRKVRELEELIHGVGKKH